MKRAEVKAAPQLYARGERRGLRDAATGMMIREHKRILFQNKNISQDDWRETEDIEGASVRAQVILAISETFERKMKEAV